MRFLRCVIDFPSDIASFVHRIMPDSGME